MGDDLDRQRKILRMNRIAGSPLLQLFERAAAVLEDLVVDGFNLTGRCQGCDQAWNAIRDEARFALAFVQRCL